MKSLILGFHSAKGGVGRTTTMCLVALELIKRGLNVLVVDTDFEAPSLDVILRTMPERVGKHPDGIESILNGTKRLTDAKDMVVDVIKKWHEPDYSKWIAEEITYGDSMAGESLANLLEQAGLDNTAGKLWLLPCARGGESLKVSYENIISSTSTKNRFTSAIEALEKDKKFDIVLVDMRNGMSDAAAIIGQSVSAIVHVTQNKLAHSVMAVEAIQWYTEMNWGIPPFTAYSQDQFADRGEQSINREAQARHEADLKKMIGGAYNAAQRRMFSGFGGPKLGSLPISPRLFLSDFGLRGYVDTQDYAEQFVDRLRDYALLQRDYSDVWKHTFTKLSVKQPTTVE